MALRVTGGQLRGRGLASLSSDAVRPTGARVRESLFSILGQDLSGLRVLDLFAGTGTLGVEAGSRGAVAVTFVEKDRVHAATVTANAVLLEGLAEVSVLVMSAERALRLLERQGGCFDVVFMDPPYGRGLAEATLHQIAAQAAGILDDAGRIVVETDTKDALPDSAGSLVKDGRDRIYGSTRLTFYREGEVAA
jgi:16S rRNA (guanine966-N2)-methyltransferase